MKIPFVGAAASAGFRTVGKILDNPWASGAMFALSGSAMIKGGINTGMEFAQDASRVDPNSLERLGNGLGELGTNTVVAGMDAYFLQHGLRRHWNVAAKDALSHEGKNYARVGKNIFEMNGGTIGANAVKSEAAETIMAKGVNGIVKSSGKFKGGIGMGAMAFALLAPMAMQMIVAPTLGFAGKVMDEMYDQQRRARMPHYDERHIVNQQQDMSTLSQVGMAMDNYSNRSISMSRIFHSR